MCKSPASTCTREQPYPSQLGKPRSAWAPVFFIFAFSFSPSQCLADILQNSFQENAFSIFVVRSQKPKRAWKHLFNSTSRFSFPLNFSRTILPLVYVKIHTQHTNQREGKPEGRRRRSSTPVRSCSVLPQKLFRSLLLKVCEGLLRFVCCFEEEGFGGRENESFMVKERERESTCVKTDQGKSGSYVSGGGSTTAVDEKLLERNKVIFC